MAIPFPPAVDAINVTDHDILRCLSHSGPLWKMEITRRVNARRAEETVLDVRDSITKQAVSKRVDRLHELEYVGTAIIAVDDVEGADVAVNRDLIIGYTLTEKGVDALKRATRHIIASVLRTGMVTGSVPPGTEEYVERYCALQDIDLDAPTLHDLVATDIATDSDAATGHGT